VNAHKIPTRILLSGHVVAAAAVNWITVFALEKLVISYT
jgi:hypothetical protein